VLFVRDPSRVVHGLDEIIRTRMLMISAGYEDGNDADHLRRDPMFKLAMNRLPGDGNLCSQSTISRLENLPDARALLRMGQAMVDHYCRSFRQVPRRIVLDIEGLPEDWGCQAATACCLIGSLERCC
jgi:Transposase DDE domain group 1